MKAQDLAQYIINHSSKGILETLKAPTRCVFCGVKTLTKTGEYLLDKDFEAWQFGAIVYDVYLFYRHYGANSIDKTNENIEITRILSSKEWILCYLNYQTTIIGSGWVCFTQKAELGI